jgi:hypothetical protein
MEIFEFVFFDLGNSAFFRVDRINQNFNIHKFFPVVAPIGNMLGSINKFSTFSATRNYPARGFFQLYNP